MMQGQVRFDDFMRHALHDPERGYYARRIAGIGDGRGDFTTAPQLSPVLARSVAAWAVRALRENGCRDLIEIGPGSGALAAAVRRLLPWPLRWRTRLHLVETSEPLARLQRQALGRRPRWHAHPDAALRACSGWAVIFSNELVDAFPVRRFKLTAVGWRELALDLDRSRPPREILLDEAPLPPSSSFRQPHAPGQWIEVHDSYREWLGEWLPGWRAGRLLTIDYGALATKLYQRRPHGSLRGYLLNQRLEGADCYLNPGRQDLTADVNFTDLSDWTAPWAETVAFGPLGGFLQPFADPARAIDRALIDPDAAGGAFRVLEQAPRAAADQNRSSNG